MNSWATASGVSVGWLLSSSWSWLSSTIPLCFKAFMKSFFVIFDITLPKKEFPEPDKDILALAWCNFNHGIENAAESGLDFSV
jgi:hypothetical protein